MNWTEPNWDYGRVAATALVALSSLFSVATAYCFGFLYAVPAEFRVFVQADVVVSLSFNLFFSIFVAALIAKSFSFFVRAFQALERFSQGVKKRRGIRRFVFWTLRYFRSREIDLMFAIGIALFLVKAIGGARALFHSPFLGLALFVVCLLLFLFFVGQRGPLGEAKKVDLPIWLKRHASQVSFCVLFVCFLLGQERYWGTITNSQNAVVGEDGELVGIMIFPTEQGILAYSPLNGLICHDDVELLLVPYTAISKIEVSNELSEVTLCK